MFDATERAKGEKIRKILSEKGSVIYFLGIGGVSMSALAEACLEKGLSVCGSDLRRNEATLHLERLGAKISYTQSCEGLNGILPSLAVYSLAVREDNPEVIRLRAMGIPLIKRAELMGALGECYETAISVSGSHGKTTASAMMTEVLSALGLSPTAFIGAEPSSPWRYVSGKEKAVVFEGCEYGGSLLALSPDVQILLNLDLDHTDCYPTLDSLKSVFLQAAKKAKRFSVINADDPILADIIKECPDKAIGFSSSEGYPYRYKIISADGSGSNFTLRCPSGREESFSLSILGIFNVVSAVASLVAADALGYNISLAGSALFRFFGVGRRLERLGNIKGVEIFYDYAHHPVEISAVFQALKDSGFKRIGVVFSPHTYSRTKAFFNEFSEALCKFEFALLTEIYAAREKNDGTVSSSMLVKSINGMGGCASVCRPSDMIQKIKSDRPDAFVIMGAGDLSEYKNAALNEMG